MWEIPTTLSHLPVLNVPYAGGVYFRVLPFALIRALFRKRLSRGYPVFGYIHPYDVDTEQERFMHPEIGDSAFYNWLLYFNRGGVLRRLRRIIASGHDRMRYDQYIEHLIQATGDRGATVPRDTQHG